MSYKKWELNPRIAPTLRAEHHNTPSVHYVLVIPKSTSTPSKSIKAISQNIKTMETSQKLTPTPFQTSTSSVADSLVRLLALLESDEDSTILEGLCSSTFAALRKPNGLGFSSLRTSKDYSITTGGKLSEPLSPRWMNWGTTVNGKCVTARISVSPKTGNGSSLSDILEEHPDPKYFLSREATQKILNNSMKEKAKVIESTERGGVAPTQASQAGGVGAKTCLIAHTVRSSGRASGVDKKQNWDSYNFDGVIRRLTPTECERLQGFPDGWTAGVSDTQRYKTLGNAVTVNVIQAVISKIL